MGDLTILPHVSIYSIIYFFCMNSWVFLYTSSYNPTLLCFVPIIPASATESSCNWVLCPFDISWARCVWGWAGEVGEMGERAGVLFFLFSYFLAVSQAHFMYLLSQPQRQPFLQKALAPLIEEWYQKKNKIFCFVFLILFNNYIASALWKYYNNKFNLLLIGVHLGFHQSESES